MLNATSIYAHFGEKESVTSCAPTNSPTPIRTLGQPLIFGFETIRTIGTYIQLVTAKSTIFFWRSEKVGQLRSYETEDGPLAFGKF